MDEAHRLTDEKIEELEEKISRVYKDAREDLKKTIDKYFRDFERLDKQKRAAVEKGDMTEKDYLEWKRRKLLTGDRYTALRDKIAERYNEANNVAVAYINDATPGIYALNRNYVSYEINQVKNVDFILYNEQAVKRLIVENPAVMPYYPPKRAVDRGIDLEWGKKQITASINQGILTGKSIPKIAKDLQDRIEGMNKTSAVRAARTAMTGAQNAGRQAQMEKAAEMGIEMERQWVAVLDNRTRHEHQLLDGQRRGVNEPFSVEGIEIMFPGDTSAPGHLVYNCRCDLKSVLKGITGRNERIARDENGKNYKVKNMTYVEWAASRGVK